MNLIPEKFCSYSRLLGGIMVIGAILRLVNFGAPLEYDEIWTWEYFASRDVGTIFSELALPNNQPLNSLAVKILSILGIPAAIRLHSLICGVALIGLTAAIGKKLWGSARAALWSAFFMACCAPAAAYAQQARGYELQLFFLALYAWGLLYSGPERAWHWRYWPEAALIGGGVGAILTLSTSVIYLTLMTGFAAVVYRRKPERSTVLVLAGGVIFALVWYLGNLTQFVAGTQWGTKLTSLADFGRFCRQNYLELGFFTPVGWLAWGALLLPGRNRKTAWLGIAILLIPSWLSSVLTHAGPVRTYLPLTILLALWGGWGATAVVENAVSRRGKIFLSLLALVCGVLSYQVLEPRWRSVNWQPVVDAALTASPDTLAVYPATVGLPLQWNFPQVVSDQTQRINGNAKFRKLWVFNAPGCINGTDASYNETSWKLKPQGKMLQYGTVTGREYRLAQLDTAVARDDIILVVMNTLNSTKLTQFKEFLDACGAKLILNIFLLDDESPVRLWAVKVANPELLSADRRPAGLDFYRVLDGQ